jgi:hypothetical protein
MDDMPHIRQSCSACDLAIEEFFPAVGNDQVPACCIEAHVVGVGSELSRLQERKRSAVEDLHGAVARGGDEQVVGGVGLSNAYFKSLGLPSLFLS